MPDSAEVLSEAAGRVKRKCLVRMRATAVMARASCASVSKHAMYACAFLVSCGQCLRTSVMSHCSENQAKLCDVLIQPPTPTVEPSAIASAAAKQCSCGAWRTKRSWSCEKQDESQRSAARLSFLRCISLRMGSDMRTHCGFAEDTTLGTSALLRIF